jgi:hypothetical protein
VVPSTSTLPSVAPDISARLDSLDPDIVDTVIGLLDDDVTVTDVEALTAVPLDSLDPVVLSAIVESLNDAPDDVRAVFEDEVNVFGGAVDAYIPSGSNVTVGTRRTIVAVTATVMSPVSPVAATRRRKV